MPPDRSIFSFKTTKHRNVKEPRKLQDDSTWEPGEKPGALYSSQATATWIHESVCLFSYCH